MCMCVVAANEVRIYFALSAEGNERKHHLQDSPKLPIPIHVLRGTCCVIEMFSMAWTQYTEAEQSVHDVFQKESPELSRQSPANGHASVTSSILVSVLTEK